MQISDHLFAKTQWSNKSSSFFRSRLVVFNAYRVIEYYIILSVNVNQVSSVQIWITTTTSFIVSIIDKLLGFGVHVICNMIPSCTAFYEACFSFGFEFALDNRLFPVVCFALFMLCSLVVLGISWPKSCYQHIVNNDDWS